MGTESWLLVGTETAMRETFGSTCHGAGRLLSRHAARKVRSGAEVRRELEDAGIVVKAASVGGLAEEAPFAYKDVADVVASWTPSASRARSRGCAPLGVLKG